jgi:quercetin dioxygenase-like cupin family protein
LWYGGEVIVPPSPVPGPSSAQLLHPAARFAALLAAEALPRQALADIAAGLARIDRSVPEQAGSAPGTPRSIRLIGTEVYDVWLITWPSGTGMSHHDHGSSLSVLQVVSGILAEIHAPAGEPGRTRLLETGCSAVTEPGQAHELWNPGPSEATSVHVYSPPLETVTYSGRPVRARHTSRRRVRSFAGVGAEATSPHALR